MLDFFRQELAIDLGTANTLVALKDKGVVINEPSVIALDKDTKEVIAVGSQAKDMLGRSPGNIIANFPLQDGVIHDFDTAEAMLRYFLQQSSNIYPNVLHLMRSRVVIGLPTSATEVEVNALRDASRLAGAGQVILVPEPLAVNALLSQHDQKAKGRLVVDIGGGTTDIIVVTMNGIVADKTIKIAGDEMTRAVSDFVRDKYNMQIGLNTAEELKKAIGTLVESNSSQLLRGRDLTTGYPKTITVKGHELVEPLSKIFDQIISHILGAIELTSPDILSDILSQNVVLTGGGSLLAGAAKYISAKIATPVEVLPAPLTAVVEGLNYLMTNPKLLAQMSIKEWSLI